MSDYSLEESYAKLKGVVDSAELSRLRKWKGPNRAEMKTYCELNQKTRAGKQKISDNGTYITNEYVISPYKDGKFRTVVITSLHCEFVTYGVDSAGQDTRNGVVVAKDAAKIFVRL